MLKLVERVFDIYRQINEWKLGLIVILDTKW